MARNRAPSPERTLTVLSPELADRIQGPDWLRRRRAEAAERVAGAALPSTAEEVWRYSRIDELDLDSFQPVAGELMGSDRGLDRELDTVFEALGDVAGLVLVHNGSVARCELDDDAARAGVKLGSVLDDGAGRAVANSEMIGSVADQPTDLFGHLNDAFTLSPIVIDVPPQVKLARPLVVIDWLDADGIMTFPRLAVRAGEGSQATVIEWHGSADVRSLASPVTELDVEPTARLDHVTVQLRGPRIWQIASHVSRVGEQATFSSYHAALGGDYARARTDCRLIGRGASGGLSAMYFGEGNQMLDFRTFQDHRAPDTTSNLLFKGAVGGHSRSVYTGLIKVEKSARGTNAFQTNRNLKLSDGAWAESVPNLEIENNDVHCSHASTVGPVDVDQRFYLESRGVPTVVAERLIVAGFFDEVLEKVPAIGVIAELRTQLQERLEQVELPGAAIT